jgi:hypothetical protein
MLKARVKARSPETAKPVQMDQRHGQTAQAGGCVGSTQAQTRASQPGAELRAFVQRELEIGVRLED